MKGQVHLMEYVLLSFFVLLIIVMLTFFLTGWQMSSIGSEKTRVIYNKAEFLMRAFANSPYINRNTYKEGSMFEDVKLLSITCENLQKLYGTDWYAEIETIEASESCTEENFPLCGKWSYCKKEGESITFELPVNIYRVVTGKVEPAILKVGLYR